MTCPGRGSSRTLRGEFVVSPARNTNPSIPTVTFRTVSDHPDAPIDCLFDTTGDA
jgi:hypothetical protein